MKKYRVTSIPQSLPEAKKGKELKNSKFEKKKYDLTKKGVNLFDDIFRKDRSSNDSSNSIINYTPPSPETEVQMDLPQPSYWDQQPNDIYRPGYFDELYEQDYGTDSYKDVNTGKPMQCPPGYTAYKGECIPDAEAEKLYAREFEDWKRIEDQKTLDRQTQFEADIQKIRDENEKNRLTQYAETFNTSKKRDKIKPQYTIPWENLVGETPVINEDGSVQTDENGQPITESNLSSLKRTHYVQKNNDGTYSMWPLEAMYKKIIDNGFTKDQFKNYWGLDPEQVESQLAPVIEASQAQYDATMTNKILTRALEERKTVGDVINELPSSLGYKDAMTKRFKGKVNDIVDEAFAEQVSFMLAEQNKEAQQNLTPKQLEYVMQSGQGPVANPDLSGMPVEFSPLLKKDSKEFDFEKDGVRTYKEKLPSGKYIDKEYYDPIGAYTEHWINQAETEAEKNKRRAEVTEIQEGGGSEYSKTYQENLNSSGYNDALDEHNQRQDLIHKTVGSDQMRQIADYGFQNQWTTTKADAAQAASEAEETAKIEKLIKLTGFNDAYSKWVGKTYKDDINKITQAALQNPNIATDDKLAYLSDLQNQVSDAGMNLLNYQVNKNGAFDLGVSTYPNDSIPTYADLLGNVGSLKSLADKFEYEKTRPQLKAGTFKPEIGTGDKVLDVLSHPFHAIQHAMDPRSTMWGDHDNMTFRERKYLADKTGENFGTGLGFTPMGILDTSFNPFNPVMWGTSTREGYDHSGITGALGQLGRNTVDLALARATRGLGNYIRPAAAMSKFNPFRYLGKPGRALGTGISDYFAKSTPGFLLESPENYQQAVADYENKNYWDAAGNALLTTWGVSPYARPIAKSIRALQTPGSQVKFINPNARYNVTIGTPAMNSGVSFGNPTENLMGTSRFPGLRNKLYDKTGILFDVKTGNLKPTRYLKKQGGSVELPKAKYGIEKAAMKLLNNPALSGVKRDWSGAISGIYNPYFKTFVTPMADLQSLNETGDSYLKRLKQWESTAKQDLTNLEDKVLHINDPDKYATKATEEFYDYMTKYNKLKDNVDKYEKGSEEFENAMKKFVNYLSDFQPPFSPETMQLIPYNLMSNISDQSQNIVKSGYDKFDFLLDKYNLEKAIDQGKIDAYRNAPLSYKLFGLSPGWKMAGIHHPYETDVLFPHHRSNTAGKEISKLAWDNDYNRISNLYDFHPWSPLGGKKYLQYSDDVEKYLDSKTALQKLISFPSENPSSGDDDLLQEMEKDGGIVMELDDDQIAKYAKNGYIIEDF